MVEQYFETIIHNNNVSIAVIFILNLVKVQCFLEKAANFFKLKINIINIQDAR